eukprot:Blabericola_migrator_1__8324@NODE_4325_length_1220_cov_31_045967_g1938_i1_p1_GENE_NODE_4325_length_1220_cov_31_045967_g1938_i1NODE_4325_length_1220_cov_31_045967_g1938_i1_p1_ORF_typecomplete_len236_score7_89Paramecium_SA/PF01508_16/1_6Paramecium_SA/PF01508_16/5_4DUF11/PF01345_18/75DUF11/PF01345_18/11_NODE_4325_length_1220_cov_31_045967_g1938_i1156863
MYTLIRKHAKHFHPHSMQRIVIPKTCRALPFRRMQSTEFTALLMQCERPISRKRTTHSQHVHHLHPTSCQAFLPTGCTLSSESTPSTSTLSACTSLPPQQHAKHSRPHSVQRIVIPKTCRALLSRRMQNTEFTALLMQCERPLSRKRTTHSQHAHHPHPTSCKAFLPTGCTLSSESTPSTSSLTTCTSLPPQQHAKHSRPHSMQRIIIPKTCRALPSRRMQSTELTALLMQCERP